MAIVSHALARAGLPQSVANDFDRWVISWRIQSAEGGRVPRVMSRVERPSGFAAARFSDLAPRPAANRSWIEVVAAGAPISAQALASSLGLVSMETARTASYNDSVRNDPAKGLFTFTQRIVASGCSYLVVAVDLDQSVDVSRSRSWSESPRKRIALDAAQLRQGPPPVCVEAARRNPQALVREAAIRSLCASISGSWRSYLGALNCLGAYMDVVHPGAPRFPVSFDVLSAWSFFFASGASFKTYLAALKFGSRMSQKLILIHGGMEGALIRAAPRSHVQKECPRYLRAHILALIDVALRRQRRPRQSVRRGQDVEVQGGR